jgi:putative cardiolipin synthase
MAESFNKYWSNENAFKVSELYKPNKDPEFLQKFRQKLQESREKAIKKAEEENDNFPALDDYIRSSGETFVWSDAEFYADEPAKINNLDFHAEDGPLQTVFALGEKAEREFLIISPYFVPGEDGLTWLQSLRAGGVKIRIITNSLASTDVVAVHTGYNSYRKAILDSDIEIFEMKPLNSGRTRQRLIGARTPSHASLHAKVYIADKKTVIVGSLNFDPRSAQLNTEVALLIHSETIAKQLSDLYENVILPKSSYRLALEGNKLAWHSEEKGRKRVYYIEPEASPWRRLQAFLIDFLPLEKQL